MQEPPVWEHRRAVRLTPPIRPQKLHDPGVTPTLFEFAKWFIASFPLSNHESLTMSKYKYIEESTVGDVTVVVVANPEIQERLLVHELGDELIDVVEKVKPKKLVVDFQRVTYCSSEVIGGLIRTRRRVKAEGGQMKLCSLLPAVRELFQITNLDGTIFDIHDSADQAVAAFSKA